MQNCTVKISLSPRDHRLLKYLLPHQIKMWHKMASEILLVFDLHGYHENQTNILEIKNLVADLAVQYPNIRLITVDYSRKAKKEVSNAYFNGKKIPNKTHRYGPYYAYFYGIYHSKYDYVLNIDCDIFFGGKNENWIEEAISILDQNSNIITCSPHPGPKREDGKLIRQHGQIDDTPLRKIEFESISTRIFFIHKVSFKEKICPIPINFAKSSLLIRALIRKKPLYELPEDTITKIMLKKGLKRIDFLGTGNGLWTLHPPYRNEAFYAKLPFLVKLIESDEIPQKQRGDYDINFSMVDWSSAVSEIKEASLKLRILKKILFFNKC